MTEQATWQPDWVVSPGAILAEEMLEHNLTERFVARGLGIPPADVGALLTGDLLLSEVIAHRLSRLFGMSMAFWLRLEARYRGGLARGLSAGGHPEHLTGPAYSGKAS